MSDLPAFNPADMPPAIDSSVSDATGTDADGVGTEVDFNDPYVAAMVKNQQQREANSTGIPSHLDPLTPPAPPESDQASGTAPDGSPELSPASTDAPPESAPTAPVDAAQPSGAGAAVDASDTSAPEAPPVTSIRIGEQDISAARVEKMLELDGWAQKLPQWMRNAFAGIEQGAFVPITREDFDQFTAWKSAGAKPQSSISADDLEDLPPAVAKRLAELENEVAQRPQQPQQQFDPVAYQQAATQQAQVLAQRNQIIETVGGNFATEYGLSPAEMQDLYQHTANLQIIPRLIEQGQVFSPTGQLLKDADYSQVMESALRTGVQSHPTLSDKYIDARVAARTAKNDVIRQRVDEKKNHQASIASAPSAAVTAPSSNPDKPRNQEQLTAEIAAFLRGEIANGVSAG